MIKDRSNNPSSSGRPHGLSRSKILRGRKNFQRLFDEEAVTLQKPHVNLRYRICPQETPDCKMSFIVKKKLGKAVRRNRVKRLLREAYRLNQHILSDFVHTSQLCLHGALIANTITVDFETIEKEVVTLLQEAKSSIHPGTDS